MKTMSLRRPLMGQKAMIGPNRLSVHGSYSRTNNEMESYHSALRGRVMITHPNVFVFLGHVQRMTGDAMSDVACTDSGLAIRRAKNTLGSSMTNESSKVLNDWIPARIRV